MFLLNLQSKVPIYEQIQEQILRFIEVGILSAGDRLPSVRQLAQDNGINPNTVSKAYTELEKNGYVYNLPKKCVYVAEVDTSDNKNTQIKRVLEPLVNMGIGKDEILSVIEELYKEDALC